MGIYPGRTATLKTILNGCVTKADTIMVEAQRTGNYHAACEQMKEQLRETSRHSPTSPKGRDALRDTQAAITSRLQALQAASEYVEAVREAGYDVYTLTPTNGSPALDEVQRETLFTWEYDCASGLTYLCLTPGEGEDAGVLVGQVELSVLDGSGCGPVTVARAEAGCFRVSGVSLQTVRANGPVRALIPVVRAETKPPLNMPVVCDVRWFGRASRVWDGALLVAVPRHPK